MPATDVRAVAEESRERYAREVLDIVKVGQMIAEEAGAGFGGLRIRQGRPVSLQGTRAAARLQKWLQDGSYRIRWVEVPRKRKDGQLAVYAELVIWWSGDSDEFIKGVYELVRLLGGSNERQLVRQQTNINRHAPTSKLVHLPSIAPKYDRHSTVLTSHEA
ncbi:MAG: hypothetical protein HOO99_00995 [Hyphomicrobiaceae bacterium]|nr:hypothetical protein [Hyphomicrobiaceae bacterium]